MPSHATWQRGRRKVATNHKTRRAAHILYSPTHKFSSPITRLCKRKETSGRLLRSCNGSHQIPHCLRLGSGHSGLRRPHPQVELGEETQRHCCAPPTALPRPSLRLGVESLGVPVGPPARPGDAADSILAKPSLLGAHNVQIEPTMPITAHLEPAAAPQLLPASPSASPSPWSALRSTQPCSRAPQHDT